MSLKCRAATGRLARGPLQPAAMGQAGAPPLGQEVRRRPRGGGGGGRGRPIQDQDAARGAPQVSRESDSKRVIDGVLAPVLFLLPALTPATNEKWPGLGSTKDCFDIFSWLFDPLTSITGSLLGRLEQGLERCVKY